MLVHILILTVSYSPYDLSVWIWLLGPAKEWIFKDCFAVHKLFDTVSLFKSLYCRGDWYTITCLGHRVFQFYQRFQETEDSVMTLDFIYLRDESVTTTMKQNKEQHDNLHVQMHIRTSTHAKIAKLPIIIFSSMSSMKSETCVRRNIIGSKQHINAHKKLGATWRMQLITRKAKHNLQKGPWWIFVIRKIDSVFGT